MCSLLSGGLDSSAVTALAAKALKDQGAPARPVLLGRFRRRS
ncbi:asparagine synthase-related protein [Streptomyces achromogenes]|nr:asparagine synthase-related protein [Streptomyces achromogenes]